MAEADIIERELELMKNKEVVNDNISMTAR